MAICKAIQKEDKVIVYDENNNELHSYFGKLCKFDNKSVTIYYSSPVRHFCVYDDKGKKISMELEKSTLEIDFDYKGVIVRGVATYDDKNNYGVVMISPIKGLRTNNYSHINAAYPITFQAKGGSNSIETRSIEALKAAYDEYLFLIEKKSKLNFWLTLSESRKKYAEERLNDLKFVASFVKERFKKKEINEATFHKLNKIIKNEINEKKWNLGKIFADTFNDEVVFGSCFEKPAIENLVEVARKIVADEISDND